MEQHNSADFGLTDFWSAFCGVGDFVSIGCLRADFARVGAVPIAVQSMPRIDKVAVARVYGYIDVDDPRAFDSELVVLVASGSEYVWNPDEILLKTKQERSGVNTAIHIGGDKLNTHAVVIGRKVKIDSLKGAGVVRETPYP